MNNRLEDLLPCDNPPRGRVPRENSAVRDEAEQYARLAGRWSLAHPVECLAAALAVGVLIGWFLKRR